MATQKRTQFTLRASPTSGEALIFRYLRGLESKTINQQQGRQMAIHALVAFWEPFALEKSKGKQSVELEIAARNSIEQLIRQANWIAKTFQLDIQIGTNQRGEPIAPPSAPEVKIILSADASTGFVPQAQFRSAPSSSVANQNASHPSASHTSSNEDGGRIVEVLEEASVLDEGQMKEIDATPEDLLGGLFV